MTQLRASSRFCWLSRLEKLFLVAPSAENKNQLRLLHSNGNVVCRYGSLGLDPYLWKTISSGRFAPPVFIGSCRRNFSTYPLPSPVSTMSRVKGRPPRVQPTDTGLITVRLKGA